MDSSSRHFFLYAKDHYQMTDPIQDLKKIMGNRCGYSPKYVRENDINNILLDLVYPLMQKRGNPRNEFIEFVYEVKAHSIIEAALCFLAITPVNDIDFELGDADPKILPLPEHGRGTNA